MSRSCPQSASREGGTGRSRACGLVAIRSPQTVEERPGPRVAVRLSTVRPQGSPCCAQPFHTVVHCSATQHPSSPTRVNCITSTRRIGLCRTWVKLGTPLGRTRPSLCTACAELFPVHRTGELSTGPAHRARGQKTAAELRKAGYPRFPQALLLRPRSYRGKSVSKWGLCTTRPRAAPRLPARLDPGAHRVSVLCVRLDRRHTADDEGQQDEPATAGGGLR